MRRLTKTPTLSQQRVPTHALDAIKFSLSVVQEHGKFISSIIIVSSVVVKIVAIALFSDYQMMRLALTGKFQNGALDFLAMSVLILFWYYQKG